MSTSAWIDVVRKEGLRDRARAYKVMIDGQEAGSISHGPSWSHRARTRCSSRSIGVAVRS
jgi:hypothetical protein